MPQLSASVAPASILQAASMEDLQRQVELEARSLELGKRQYHKRVDSQGHADTQPGNRIVRTYIEPLTESIRDWLESQGPGKRRGLKVTGLETAKPEEMALLTIRLALNGATGRGASYTSTAIALGGMVEEHLSWKRMLGDKEVAGFALAVARRLKSSTSERHRRAAARAAARHVDKAPTDWSTATKAKLGMHLLERLVHTTGLFRKKRLGVGVRSTMLLEPEPALEDFLRNAHERCAAPASLPMVIEPIQWESPRSGGYLTRRLPVVKSDRQGDTLRAIEEGHGHMSEVYDTLNVLQATKWRINRAVEQVMRTAWEAGDQLGCLPPREDEPVPAKPHDIATNEEARKHWRDRAAQVHRANAETRVKRTDIAAKLATARLLIDEPELHYVYQLDWRGRYYPVGGLITPQSDDVGRSLLQFAKGQPLGVDGAYWLAVHLANTYGYDKASLDDRVAWVEEHSKEILDSALEPLDGERFWTAADKPWMFLAACFEWAGYMLEGSEYVSHLPVAVDGSCNGLQHFSALLRDQVGGRATNLVPAEKPADIYQTVCDAVIESLQQTIFEGEDEDAVAAARRWLARGVDRKLVKRPVMTLPYGATLFGMRDQTLDECRKRGLRDVDIRDAAFFAATVWEAIGTVVVAAREAMDWLQRATKVLSEHEVDPAWLSPGGLPVVQGYRKSRGYVVTVRVGGIRKQACLREDTPARDKARQVLAISPNFIHSLDASHMQSTVLSGYANGIEDFSMVHDSYAVHASHVSDLSAILRETFILQYEEPVLEVLRDQLQARLPEGVELPPLPEPGELDLSAVRESLYFFA